MATNQRHAGAERGEGASLICAGRPAGEARGARSRAPAGRRALAARRAQPAGGRGPGNQRPPQSDGANRRDRKARERIGGTVRHGVAKGEPLELPTQQRRGGGEGHAGKQRGEGRRRAPAARPRREPRRGRTERSGGGGPTVAVPSWRWADRSSSLWSGADRSSPPVIGAR